ncbi:MAG: SIMPL domain-containing protein [Actinobacteria bacterium]|nr:SIMPL domain-containing protein [Actinomycetota bacterium]
MKKIKFISVSFIIVIFIAFSAVILPGCIGQKPPRYTNESVTTQTVTDETVYGSTADSQKTPALSGAKTIVVTSEQTVKVMPDIVMVNIIISTEKPSSEEAVNENSKETQNVITAIKASGDSDLKIETTGYILRPLYNYVENKPPVIYAFNAVTTLLVTTQKIEKIGTVISTAVEAGATDISSINYDLSDDAKKAAKKEALTKAVKDANDKADAIAKAMAADIVEIYSVNEGGTSYPGPIKYETSDQLKAANAAVPVILPQELELKANISVIYIFK